MKKFYCIASVLLMVLLGALLLSSCSSPVQESGSAPTQETGGVILDEKTSIVENGVAKYFIVYPQNASASVRRAALNFQQAVCKLTGVNLPLTDDEALVMGDNQNYILIGDTVLPASEEVKSLLADSADSYAILKAGNHIVVAAKEDAVLPDAVSHYEDEFMGDYDPVTNTLYFIGTDDVPEPAFTGFDLAELARYRIVYSETPAGLRATALLLQKEIKAKTGIKIPVYADTQRIPGAYEILIGQTNRELSRDVYAGCGYVMQYGVTVRGASLQMACGGTFSARKCVEQFVESFLAEGNAQLNEGVHTELSAELASTSVPHTEGTTARIMTLNIMPDILGAQEYPNVLSVNDRVEILAGMLINYTPDVIGLQETCEVWEKQIPYYLDVVRDNYGIDYDIVLNSYDGLNNYTPIIYREDKYTLDFAKYEPYEYDIASAIKRGYYIRGASQIKVTEKNSGTTFIVVNSHWDHGGGTSSNPTNPQYTQYCADNEAAIIAAYKAEYPDVRIFATGDFNNHRPHIKVIFKEFISEVNGQVASELAKADGTLIVTGGYQCNDNLLIEEDVPREAISSHSKDFIDHVVGMNGKFKVLRHDTILVNYCHVMTDHMPVYADIMFQ